MKNLILGTAALVTAGLMSIGTVNTAPSNAGTTDHPTPRWMSRVCAAEDSVNCFRDDSFGHRDFYARRMPGHPRVVCRFFVTRTDLDYCARER